jgi:hypothetical protein
MGLVFVINIVFMDWALLGLLRRVERYVGPIIIAVGGLCFVVLLGCMLKFSLKFVYLPLVERDITTVIWILEFYYLD